MIENSQKYYLICDEILKIDNLIRFAGIYVQGEFYHKIQE